MTLLFRTAFFLTLCIVTVLALIPDYSQLPPVVNISDLLNHTAAFTVLSFLYLNSFKHAYRVMLSFLGAYAIAIEAVQSLLPTRYASIEDIMADLLGIMLGIMVSKTAHRRKINLKQSG